MRFTISDDAIWEALKRLPDNSIASLLHNVAAETTDVQLRALLTEASARLRRGN